MISVHWKRKLDFKCNVYKSAHAFVFLCYRNQSFHICWHQQHACGCRYGPISVDNIWQLKYQSGSTVYNTGSKRPSENLLWGHQFPFLNAFLISSNASERPWENKESLILKLTVFFFFVCIVVPRKSVFVSTIEFKGNSRANPVTFPWGNPVSSHFLAPPCTPPPPPLHTAFLPFLPPSPCDQRLQQSAGPSEGLKKSSLLIRQASLARCTPQPPSPPPVLFLK